MSHLPFSGVITAIATPFIRGGDIDFPAFTALLKAQKDSGIHGIMIAGTTGESPTLTSEERIELLRVAMQERSESFHIYAGIGCNSTLKSVKSALDVISHFPNVDGLMAVVPYYNKPSQQGLQEHFSMIAEKIGTIPFCIYNVPGRTCCNLLPKTLVDLARTHSNIAALKEASGDICAIAGTRAALDEAQLSNVRILSGDDNTFAPALVAGAEGSISVSSNIIPKGILSTLQAFRDNNLRELQRLHFATRAINAGLFLAANPIPLKWALGHLGYGDGSLRLPMAPLDTGLQSQLKQLMENLSKHDIHLLQRRFQ